MKIDPGNGLMTVTFEAPAFIGSTLSADTTFFSPPGTKYDIFVFKPKLGDWGTLVFDQADETRRGPNTLLFLQFWWNKGRRVMRPGLDNWWFIPGLQIDSNWGRYYTASPPGTKIVYHDGYYDGVVRERRLVRTPDLLSLAEGKFDLEELDRRVIEVKQVTETA